jgi:hypothetical protein
MGELEKQPFESEIHDLSESPATKPETDGSTSLERPDNNWEGYSLEILSIWFDP